MKKILAVLFALWPAFASAQIVGTLPFQLQNGTTADATQVMADFNKILNDTNANAAKNGVNTDITALTALVTPITPAQGGTPVYFASTSGGTANAQTVASPTPTGFTLAVGKRITFVAGFTNTTAMTLNVNGTGATNVFKYTPSGPIALSGGEVISGNYIEAVYDGTQYQLYTDATPDGGYGPRVTIASAATTDLGTAPSHNVVISGTTTITSFGSTATTTYPIYILTFNGVLTVTYNAATLVLPSLANIVTAVGDSAVMEYRGSGAWRMLSYSRLSGTAVVNPTPLAGAQGLTIQNNAGTPNTNIDVTFDQAVMINPTGLVPIYAFGTSLVINTTTTGANGLDTGARANSTWYNIWLISDGTTTAGLASLSATAPTMPGVYVYKVRIGAMRTDGSGNFYRTRQLGSRAQYAVAAATNTAAMPLVATGSIGTYSQTAPVYVSTAITSFVPPTATEFAFVAMSQYNGNGVAAWIVAPNTAYGGNAATNPGYLGNTALTGVNGPWLGNMVLDTQAIAIASSGLGFGLFASGWKDKVNAN